MDLQAKIDNYKSEHLWTEDYENYVIEVLENKHSHKDSKYYYIKKNFKIVNSGGIKKVSKLNEYKIMATRKNTLSIISEMHTACGHKGEKKTHKKVKEQYANIPISLIKLYIQQCKNCIEKPKNVSHTEVVLLPITASDLNERGRVNLLDYHNIPDGEFKFILHYQEHLTKYSFLRPLKSKSSVEIAKELLDIFLNFGAPHVLESDCGRDFTASIIEELGSLWPDIILVNGRSRQSESQKPIKKGNHTLIDSLGAWMCERNTSSWTSGLLFVQWGMNTTYHETIQTEPCKAMFSQYPRMGLRSKIPKVFLRQINNGLHEEEMEAIIHVNDADDTHEPLINISESQDNKTYVNNTII